MPLTPTNVEAAIRAHQVPIENYAQNLLYNLNPIQPLVIEFLNVSSEAYTVLEPHRVLINFTPDLLSKSPNVGIKLLAHEMIHALRPHTCVELGLCNYLEEGVAEWFEEQYMIHAGLPFSPKLYTSNILMKYNLAKELYRNVHIQRNIQCTY